MKISKEKLQKFNALEEAAEKAGGFIDKTAKSPSYHIRNMHKYCVDHGKDIEKLTPAEREIFRSPDTPNTKTKAL